MIFDKMLPLRKVTKHHNHNLIIIHEQNFPQSSIHNVACIYMACMQVVKTNKKI